MVTSLGCASLRVAGLNLPRKGAYSGVGRSLVRYDDWWFNMQPSNTEPLLRLDAEANTEPRRASERDRLLAKMV